MLHTLYTLHTLVLCTNVQYTLTQPLIVSRSCFKGLNVLQNLWCESILTDDDRKETSLPRKHLLAVIWPPANPWKFFCPAKMRPHHAVTLLGNRLSLTIALDTFQPIPSVSCWTIGPLAGQPCPYIWPRPGHEVRAEADLSFFSVANYTSVHIVVCSGPVIQRWV